MIEQEYRASVQRFIDCLDDPWIMADVVDYMTFDQVELLKLAIDAKCERCLFESWIN